MKTGFGYLRSKTSYFSYKSKKDDLAHMQAMGEAGAEDYKMSEVDSKEEQGDDIFEDSVYEIFRDDLIVRAPDKMIDYFDGYIMLAYRNVIFYVKVDGKQIEATNKSPVTIIEKINQSDKIRQLNLSEGYKIVCI